MGDYMDDMHYEDCTPSEDYSRGYAAGRKTGYHEGYAQAKREVAKLEERKRLECRAMCGRPMNDE